MTKQSRRGFVKGSGAAIAGVVGVGAAGTATADTQQVNIYASDATQFGEAVYITGDVPELGNWETAYKMTPQSGYWAYKPELPLGTEFKLVKADWTDADAISTDDVVWNEGGNTVFEGQSVISLYPEF